MPRPLRLSILSLFLGLWVVDASAWAQRSSSRSSRGSSVSRSSSSKSSYQGRSASSSRSRSSVSISSGSRSVSSRPALPSRPSPAPSTRASTRSISPTPSASSSRGYSSPTPSAPPAPAASGSGSSFRSASSVRIPAPSTDRSRATTRIVTPAPPSTGLSGARWPTSNTAPTTYSAPVAAPTGTVTSTGAWSSPPSSLGPTVIDLRNSVRTRQPAARVPDLYGGPTRLSGARAVPPSRGSLPTVRLSDRAQLDAVWERYPLSNSSSTTPSRAKVPATRPLPSSRSLSRGRIASTTPAGRRPSLSAPTPPAKSVAASTTHPGRDYGQLRKRYAAAQASDPTLAGNVASASRAAAAAATLSTGIVLSGSGIIVGSGYCPDYASDPVGWCNWWYWNDFYPGFCGYWLGNCGIWFGWGYCPFSWFCDWYWPGYGGSYGGSWYPYYSQAYPPAVVYETVVYQQAASPEVAADAPAPEYAAEAAPAVVEESPTLLRAAAEYLALGDRAFAEGRYGSAVHYYAKAVEFAPEDGVVHLVLSDALFATGDYHYAASALRRALQLAPELAATAIDKHEFYGDPADFEAQLALLEAYLEDHFLDDDARLVLAANYLFGGYAAKAVELLEAPFSLEVRQSPAGATLLGAARAAAATPAG